MRSTTRARLGRRRPSAARPRRRRPCAAVCGPAALCDVAFTASASTGRDMSARLVPWRTTREWFVVADALAPRQGTCDAVGDDECASTSSVSTALDVVNAWRARGRVPLAVDVTATLISTIRRDRAREAVDEATLRLTYAMTLIRLVNGATDTSQGRFAAPIATLAAKIGLPRELVDLRHDATHDALPTLRALRRGAMSALAWCRRAYWDAQRDAFEYASAYVRARIEGLCVIESIGRKVEDAKRAPESSSSDEDGDGGEGGDVASHVDVRAKRRMLLGELATMCPKGASHVLVEALGSWPIIARDIDYGDADVRVTHAREFIDERDWRPTLTRLCHRWPGLFASLFDVRVRDMSNACGPHDWAEVMLMCEMAQEFLASSEQKSGVEGALTRAAARFSRDPDASASAKQFVRVVQKLLGATKDAIVAADAASQPSSAPVVSSLEEAKAAQAALVASMAAGRKRKRDSRFERATAWTPCPIGVVSGVPHDELISAVDVKVRVSSGVASFRASTPRSPLIPKSIRATASASGDDGDEDDNDDDEDARTNVTDMNDDDDEEDDENDVDEDASALNVGGVRVTLTKEQRTAVAASIACLL